MNFSLALLLFAGSAMASPVPIELSIQLNDEAVRTYSVSPENGQASKFKLESRGQSFDISIFPEREPKATDLRIRFAVKTKVSESNSNWTEEFSHTVETIGGNPGSVERSLTGAHAYSLGIVIKPYDEGK